MADIEKMSREQLVEMRSLLQERNKLLARKSALSKAETIGVQPSLGERVAGRVGAGLPSFGQFAGGLAGGVAGGVVGQPFKGGIIGGTFGRMTGRLGQLGISQFKENPGKFIQDVLNPMSGGIPGAIVKNATPEQRDFLNKEFTSTLVSETLFAGLAKFGLRTLKGVAGAFIGKRTSELGFKNGFKKLIDPKFREGRVPKEIAEKTGQFFQKLRSALGRKTQDAVNKPGVGDQLVPTESISQGLDAVERTFGNIDELSINVSTAQRKVMKSLIENIKEKISKKPTGITVSELWNERKLFDETFFGRRFAPEADEYLKNVRRILNNPIRGSSDEVAESFNNYSNFIDIRESLGKQFDVIEFGGESFAVKPEKFASRLMTTSADEEVRLLKKLDGFLKADDQVISDLMTMGGAERLTQEIGAVTLGGKAISGAVGGREAIARGLAATQTKPAQVLGRGFGRFLPTGTSEIINPGNR